MDIRVLATTLETAMDNDTAAVLTEQKAQKNFDDAQVALNDAKNGHVAADGNVIEAAKALIAAVQELIDQLTPKPPVEPAA